MPPEQFTGSPIDGRADLFSLGVILYSLATGEQPFPGETMTAVSYKVVYTDPIPPAKLNPAIPAGLEAVILKCLAKSPADRYQTGEQLAQALAAMRSNSGSAVTQTGAPLLATTGSDVTLAPGSVVVRSIPPGAPAKAASQQGQTPAPKKLSKPGQFASKFAVALLCVAGAAVVVAGGWYRYAHRKPPTPPVTVPVPKPPPNPPSSFVQPPATVPTPPANTEPGKSPAANPPKTSTPPKPSAAKPSHSKTSPSQSPAPANPATAAVPGAPAQPAPSNPVTTKPQTPAPAATVAFDPRKADPNKNGKLKIDVSKFPKGLPFTILMNKLSYIHFITGDGSSLDNLYVPPGMQEFRVSFKSGGQEWDAKAVSSDFKAKKTKTLKVQLLENGKAESKITVPISKDAQLSISFSSTLGDIF